MEKPTIYVREGNQPILSVSSEFQPTALSRDRINDTFIFTPVPSDAISEVELTEDLLQILVEDLAFTYAKDSKVFTEKLKDFNITFIYNNQSNEFETTLQ